MLKELDAPSTLFFGSADREPQKTLIVDRPLILKKSEQIALQNTAASIAHYISRVDLSGQATELGIDPGLLDRCLAHDRDNTAIVYGGLDIYMGGEVPKVLEINVRPQVMGFQDSRQECLGIKDQPLMIDHFAEWLINNNFSTVHVLGSTRNPFWRGYERTAGLLRSNGFRAIFGDAQAYSDHWGDSGVDVILRLCSSAFVLDSPESEKIRQHLLKGRARIVNPLSVTFLGDRGFLGQIARDLPDLFPQQIVFDTGVTGEQLHQYPWLKLETGREYNYVVNYQDLRNWGKQALLGVINRDWDQAERFLDGKHSRDAQNIREVLDEVLKVEPSQIRWVAQEDVQPLKADLNISGENTSMSILHRAYWWINSLGNIQVSYEAYGATNSQFSQSKGKINGGSSYVVPVELE